MPHLSFTHMLKEKIPGYLKATGMSLDQLARRINIRPAMLRGLWEDTESAGWTFYETLLVLSHIVPNEVSTILEKYAPEYMDEFARNVKSNPVFPIKDSNIIRTVFQSLHHYRLYGWILGGISQEG